MKHFLMCLQTLIDSLDYTNLRLLKVEENKSILISFKYFVIFQSRIML